MSEEQLSALLAKLKEEVGLRAKFQGAADLDAAVAIAQEAGFDVSKSDWLKYQAKQTLELSDDALEKVAGGGCGNHWSMDGNETYGEDCMSTGGNTRNDNIYWCKL